MRAFAIDVTEQSGVSGFVLPGHRVNVVRYEADQSVQSGETILQNILVLASGQVFTRADERTLTNRTVTLAVTPEQVEHAGRGARQGCALPLLAGPQRSAGRGPPQAEIAGPGPDGEAVETRGGEEEGDREAARGIEGRGREEAGGAAGATAGARRPPRSPPRYTTIYRGIAQVHRVRIDQGGVAELPPRPDAVERGESQDRPDRFGTPAASPSTSGNDGERP